MVCIDASQDVRKPLGPVPTCWFVDVACYECRRKRLLALHLDWLIIFLGAFRGVHALFRFLSFQALAFLWVCLFCFLAKSISRAIEIIKQAGRAIAAMPLIVLWPLVELVRREELFIA